MKNYLFFIFLIISQTVFAECNTEFYPNGTPLMYSNDWVETEDGVPGMGHGCINGCDGVFVPRPANPLPYCKNGDCLLYPKNKWDGTYVSTGLACQKTPTLPTSSVCKSAKGVEYDTTKVKDSTGLGLVPNGCYLGCSVRFRKITEPYPIVSGEGANATTSYEYWGRYVSNGKACSAGENPIFQADGKSWISAPLNTGISVNITTGSQIVAQIGNKVEKAILTARTSQSDAVVNLIPTADNPPSPPVQTLTGAYVPMKIVQKTIGGNYDFNEVYSSLDQVENTLKSKYSDSKDFKFEYLPTTVSGWPEYNVQMTATGKDDGKISVYTMDRLRVVSPGACAATAYTFDNQTGKCKKSNGAITSSPDKVCRFTIWNGVAMNETNDPDCIDMSLNGDFSAFKEDGKVVLKIKGGQKTVTTGQFEATFIANNEIEVEGEPETPPTTTVVTNDTSSGSSGSNYNSTTLNSSGTVAQQSTNSTPPSNYNPGSGAVSIPSGGSTGTGSGGTGNDPDPDPNPGGGTGGNDPTNQPGDNTDDGNCTTPETCGLPGGSDNDGTATLMDALKARLNPLTNFAFPNHNSACPPFDLSFHAFNRDLNFHTNLACEALETHKLLIQAGFMFAYVMSAVILFLRA